MPPSRKSGTLHASRPLRKRDHNRRATLVSSSPPPPVNVIVLSSDDDDVRPLRLAQKRKRTVPVVREKEKEKAGVYVRDACAPDDVQAESSVVARLRQENEALRQERDKSRAACAKAELAASRAEVAKAKAEDKAKELGSALKRKATSLQPDFSDLEECVSCEICTLKMWRPATLVGCGHTFCEKCLYDWINTTYMRHVEKHPDFLLEPAIPEHDLRILNDPLVSAVVEHMHAEHRKRVPQPVYTCPTCRVEVEKRPVAVFALKDVVQKVAKALGDKEASPRKTTKKAAGDMWDGFFPNA